jgi:hypothetical protein
MALDNDAPKSAPQRRVIHTGRWRYSLPMRKRTFLIFLACLVIFTFPHDVRADDSVYSGDGIDVYPLQSANIQMVSETITISDKGGRERFGVDVDMIFKNHGPDTTVQMGFPILMDEVYGERVEFDPHFRTWVNGKEVQTTRKRGIPHPVKDYYHFSDAVYAYPVSFKSGESAKIKHQYAVGCTFDSIGGWNFTYILRTGALWKGVIEDFSIIYKTNVVNVPDIIGSLPKEQKASLDGSEISLFWHINNFKPQSDFKLVGGGSRFALMKRTVDEDLRGVKAFTLIMTSAELRYAKNKVFAYYGYPFKNAFVKAQFYYPGSQYTESSSYSEKKISKEHLNYIELLSKLEESKLKSETF